MKKTLLSLALSLILSVPAFAATTIGDWASVRSTPDYEGTQRSSSVAGKSANGIVFSRHNLSSYGEHYQATTSITGTKTKNVITPMSVATTEICVFCHTPHFGKTTTAPIWNRGSSASGYTAYGPTLGGTTVTFDAVSGSSLACLSCHDGVTTLDNLINKPGKSGISTSGKQDAGWVFGEVGEFIGDTTDVSTGLAGKDSSRLNIGDSGYQASSAGRTGLVSLANDHPINVKYNDGNTISTGNVGRASLRPTATAIGSITMDNARFNDSDTNHGLTTTGYYGRSDNFWAGKGSIGGAVTIQDLLRDGNYVQCASCHDPHFKNQTNTDPAVVCSYFPKIADRNAYAVYDDYTNEVDTPSIEGCNQAATGHQVTGSGLTWTNGTDNLSTTLNDMSAFLDHYMTDVDSDGLFLRRVGGNSNSGVCRTCHNK